MNCTAIVLRSRLRGWRRSLPFYVQNAGQSSERRISPFFRSTTCICDWPCTQSWIRSQGYQTGTCTCPGRRYVAKCGCHALRCNDCAVALWRQRPKYAADANNNTPSKFRLYCVVSTVCLTLLSEQATWHCRLSDAL